MWEFFQSNPIAALLTILAVGTLIGQLSVKEISLGSSAVLFVALLFGHFGVSLGKEISTLGVVLFVYAVGLQAGPRFFKSFRKRGLSFAMLAIATLLAGAAATVLVVFIFDISPALAVGIYTGSLTTTPGLAAALEATGDPNVSVGYGLAYPFGVVGVVLFVQVLPKILGKNLKNEAKSAQQKEKGPSLMVNWFEVKNPQVENKTVGDILVGEQDHLNIARVKHGDEIRPGLSTHLLHQGDLIKAVGTEAQIKKFELLVGPIVDYQDQPTKDTVSYTLIITQEEFVGKSLANLKLEDSFGVVITRIYRNDQEFTPKGKTTLEFGDTIRIVGGDDACKNFISRVGDQERKLHETRFLPLTLGLALGVLLGMIPIPIPGGGTFKFGMAGGPLLVALIAGHFGRIGPLVFHVPVPAKIFIRELGLILFLAGAGVSAGAGFWEVAQSQGLTLFGAGIIVTLIPLVVAYLFAKTVFGFDLPTSLGALCGAMTSTPGLGVVTSASDSEYPALAYATVYPVALIFVTVISKVLSYGLLHLI